MFNNRSRKKLQAQSDRVKELLTQLELARFGLAIQDKFPDVKYIRIHCNEKYPDRIAKVVALDESLENLYTHDFKDMVKDPFSIFLVKEHTKFVMPGIQQFDKKHIYLQDLVTWNQKQPFPTR